MGRRWSLVLGGCCGRVGKGFGRAEFVGWVTGSVLTRRVGGFEFRRRRCFFAETVFIFSQMHTPRL